MGIKIEKIGSYNINVFKLQSWGFNSTIQPKNYFNDFIESSKVYSYYFQESLECFE